MNLKIKEKWIKELKVMGFLLILGLLIAFKEELFYSYFPKKYAVAHNFKYKTSHKGDGVYTNQYMADGKEYSSSYAIGNGPKSKVRYGYFKQTDKYLLEYYTIAKWDVKLLLEYKLPDTTRIPPNGWTKIPDWVEEYVINKKELDN